ncbi:MAG: M55 family metallopeptidase [Clostridiales Family XIII bacterium]|jgi:D-amino peptidase|nr:M55 family metallopeptidase [Clostridiales Family XIII bacterium]
MKIFISADMEGISGVTHRDQIVPGTGEYDRGRKLLTRDVNAAIKGALEAGVDEILVNDSHGSMRNILIEELHPAARLITGFPKPLLMMEGIDESFAGAVFIGYHAMAGAYGTLSHTISGATFASVRINDKAYGETGLNAAVAGHFGIPLIAVSGDDCLKGEVLRDFPEAVYSEVKKAHGTMAVNCLSPAAAEELIAGNVAKAVSNISDYRPFVIEGPLQVDLVLKSNAIADAVTLIPGVRRVSPAEVAYQAADIVDAMRTITAMMCASCILAMDLYK